MFVLANIFQPLIDVFEELLKGIHGFVGSWGWSIVLLTVVVRAALIPLTLKQFKSMQAMQRLAPEIKALQEKYKDDRQRLNQEMMKFYRENEVNPLGSCLPLLLQFPVFIALFYMLRTDLKHDICPEKTKAALAAGEKIANVHCGNSGSFLFVPDITNKATGAVLITLIVLYVGTQLSSTLLMSATADKTQRRLFMALPFLFIGFIINFPAGLIVYWITTNTWTIAQQYIVRRTVGPLRPPPTAKDGDTSPGSLLGGLLGGGARAASDGKGASSGGGDGKPKAKPPPPPRKKRKQRSGRRR